MLMLGDIVDSLFEVPGLIFTVGGAIAVIAIIAAAITKIAIERSRERTKREVAAYVAEGTIDPEKAVAILNAGPTDNSAVEEAVVAAGLAAQAARA
ncbi:MAG: hypothetical protein ACYTG1_09725 [Planctomycetota bacterium]|jgi:hypothetical protein